MELTSLSANNLGLADAMNPVSEFGRAGEASDRMFAPETSGWGRVEATGDMLSSMAGVVAPAAAAKGLGMTAAQALQESLFGISARAQRSGGEFLADEAFASRSGKLYNFPTNAEVGDGLGRQHTGGLDIEGRPLVARYVVGGAPERTVDESLPAEALAEIVERFTGKRIQAVSKAQLPRGSVGAYSYSKSGKPLDVSVHIGLPEDDFRSVVMHETAHLIDGVAGQIPTAGASRELKPLYHYGIEGRDRSAHFTEPKDLGYSAEKAPYEYRAEAIRQYMAAPDAMKARAPKMAANIRKRVNASPYAAAR